ncbi:MAG: GNAT family N-acetyltransferase [Candidatus Spyradocola sp.]|jgi:GNAT superfamily N-acetyltransferase
MQSLQSAAMRAAARPLFAGWEETLIESCLDGSMGEILADDAAAPRLAAAQLGDFGFLAGDAQDPAAEDLVRAVLAHAPHGYVLAVPQSEAWAGCIQRACPQGWQRLPRYATKKDPSAFDRGHLEALAAACPAPAVLEPLGPEAYARTRAEEWSRDLTAMYADYEAFAAQSLGVVAVRNGEIVAGASGYSRYRGGIEIQIDTRSDCRRQGLAAACAARLLLNCLDRGLYPSWDAANLASLSLAEKLGYSFSHAYAAYLLVPPGRKAVLA